MGSNPPKSLADARVAILGLGLMGGSLALALRGRCDRILGIDQDEKTVSLAERQRVVDRVSYAAADLLPEADIVVLATPVGAIISLLAELPSLHPGNPVVLDLGSTKVKVMDAMSTLPSRFDPLGGHPMCGKSQVTLANADSSLFQGAPFVFTPLLRTSGNARSLATQLAQAVGATPIWLDPDTHDRWTAATSHLPYLLASALTAATTEDAAALIGPGFRSATRLASTPPSVMVDILLTNKRNILESLGHFRERLALIEGHLLQEDRQALEQLLARCARHRDQLTQNQNRNEHE